MRGMTAINAESDFEVFKLALPANLKTLEVLLASDTENPDFNLMLAQGWGGYAQLAMEDEIDLADLAGDLARVAHLKARATAMYRKGQEYAARLLGGRAELIENRDAEQVKKVLAEFTISDVPALVWYAFNWVGQINLNQSNMALVAGLAKVEMTLERAIELEANYYYGLPYLLAGCIASARPAMLGGNLEKGRALFEKAIAVTQGRFLLAKFMFARYWAVQAQDRKAYCDLLRDVITAPEELLPEQRLMNTVAKIWAERWRKRAGDLFAEGGLCDPIEKETEVEYESLD